MLRQRKRGPEQWLLPPPSQRGKSLQQLGQTAAQREEYGGRGEGRDCFTGLHQLSAIQFVLYICTPSISSA